MLHKNIYNILISRQYIYVIFYNTYPLGNQIIISIENHVMPFLHNISISKDFCSTVDLKVKNSPSYEVKWTN